uniref:Phospholipid phosphatase 1 n=1 Tax=Gopherus agassizii TaxID=38772 RepID=A0A452II99_9SAUR
ISVRGGGTQRAAVRGDWPAAVARSRNGTSAQGRLHARRSPAGARPFLKAAARVGAAVAAAAAAAASARRRWLDAAEPLPLSPDTKPRRSPRPSQRSSRRRRPGLAGCLTRRGCPSCSWTWSAWCWIIIGEGLSVYYNCLHSNSFVRNNYIATIYKAIGTFIFGAAASQSLTDIAKYSIGRLRPHFLAICQPDWTRVNCSLGYIENFPCQGDKVQVNEGRLSFYSGHSSFSMYCMLFLALYLQARMKGDWARLVRPTAQFGLIAASIYVGLSRVSDYKHHWSDVLTGLLQGAVVAVLIVVYVSDFFKVRGCTFKPNEDSHTTLHETPTNGNHYGSNHQP